MSAVAERGLPWPPRKEDLERLYLDEKLSAAKIARVYGLKYKNPKVAESTILYQLEKNGIGRRDRAEHVRRVSEVMVDGWVKRYQDGESLEQIAGGNFDPVTVWNHLKARNLVLRDRVEAQIQAVTKYRRTPFLGDAIEKAYLVGLRYGDLDVVRHGRAIRVRVSTTHPAMAELFENLFSPYGHVSCYPRTAPFTGYEWSLESDLDSSFEFLLRKPSLDELKLLTTDEFMSFLAGIFDAEGTITLHRKRFGVGFEISLSNRDSGLLDFISMRLGASGYHPVIDARTQDPLRLGYYKEGVVLRLSLFRQHEVCRMLESIRARLDEKVRKSRFIREQVCGNSLGIGKVEIAHWTSLTAEIRGARDEFVEQARIGFEAKALGIR